jgi:large subunit ribosomal protein L22
MKSQTAQLRFLRMSPRKVRLVVDLIKKSPAIEAESLLVYSKKRAAKPLLKLLRSAMASAKSQNSVNKENLYIDKVLVNQGPSLKRYRFRAQGRVGLILKRSSHIIIVLNQLKEGKKKLIVAKNPQLSYEKNRDLNKEQEDVQKKVSLKTKDRVAKESKFRNLGNTFSGFTKRIFRRKSV